MTEVFQTLYNMIQDSTRVLSKGESAEAGLIEAPFEKVDVIFLDVVVNRTKAERYENAVMAELENYPDPRRLSEGPSYMELAINLGLEQVDALRLMAMGETLRLWTIESGKNRGMDDATARTMAARGQLNISGYDATLSYFQ
ncbi:MAG: hypothetical protein GOV00_03890 [Candidatus Altiarchaeota archaeon]|nr:hypothetical protein [Candidatus Altiarchaeota archaeon]